MPKRTANFREQLLKDLASPSEAALYLNAAEEDSEEMLLIALRDVAEAKQMAQVAEQAGVAREALYRMLSKSGNPTYNSLKGVLSALGIHMRFAPVGSWGSVPNHSVIGVRNANAVGSFSSCELQGSAKRRPPVREQASAAGGVNGRQFCASARPRQ